MRETFENLVDTLVFGLSVLLPMGIALLILIFLAFVMFDIVNGADPIFGSEFDRRDAFMQQCLSSEQYTREECIILARPQVSK